MCVESAATPCGMLKYTRRTAKRYLLLQQFAANNLIVIWGALKTRDWKTRHQTAGVENAGLENAGV